MTIINENVSCLLCTDTGSTTTVGEDKAVSVESAEADTIILPK